MLPRILIVDDEVSWVSSHKELIENEFPAAFEYILASSAREALKLIKKEKPDLLITDLVMEDIKKHMYAGEFLVKQAKKLYPDLNIIIISGSSDGNNIAIRNGVRHFISKTLIFSYPLKLKLIISEIFGIKTEIC